MQEITVSDNPKVSVITIAYNNCDGLRQTIASVEQQDYPNIEYVIIDGGSKDGSVQLMKEHDASIAYWCSEPDNGVYHAMNKGVDKMTGEWCIFMNSGDVFHDSRSLRSLVSVQRSPRTGIVYGDVSVVFDHYGVINKVYGQLSGENLTGICHQSSLIRCDLMKRHKYDESFKITADVNFFHILVREGYEFLYIPQVISVFKVGGISWKPSFRLMNEYQRVYGTSKCSVKYFKCLLSFSLKILLCRLLPANVYNYLIYLSYKRKYGNE